MNELIDFICASGFYTPEFIVKIFIILFVCGFYSTIIRAIGKFTR